MQVNILVILLQYSSVFQKKISTLYLVNRTLETFFWDTLLRVRIEIQIQGVPKNVSRVQKGKYKERKCFLRHPVDFLPPRNGNLISFLNHFFLSLGCFVVGMLTQWTLWLHLVKYQHFQVWEWSDSRNCVQLYITNTYTPGKMYRLQPLVTTKLRQKHS